MPKIVDHDQYRKELLDKCLDVIAAKGYTAITMRQIAQGLGVSTGTLYHYFPSKESLFEQLVEQISYQDTADEAIAALKQLPTTRERIEAIFDYVAQREDYFLRQTLMLIDFGRQRSRSEITNNDILRRAGERYEKAVMQILEINDPELVKLMMNLCDGLLLRRLYQGDRISLQPQIKLIVDIMATYLSDRN